MLALLEEERANDEIARAVYGLRTEAGLSHQRLAKLVGTTSTAIRDLEEGDYNGNYIGMLYRIAAALNRRVEIRVTRARAKRLSM